MYIVVLFTDENISGLLYFLKETKIQTYWFNDEYINYKNNLNNEGICIINVGKQNVTEIDKHKLCIYEKKDGEYDDDFNITTNSWIHLTNAIANKKITPSDIFMTGTLKELFENAIWGNSEGEGNMSTVGNIPLSKQYLKDYKSVKKFYVKVQNNIM